jgi:HTH-type transcriptional regulator/antitoxin HigA
MEFKVIKTEREYNKALAMFEKVFLAKKGTKDSDDADILAMLIGQYETEP